MMGFPRTSEMMGFLGMGNRFGITYAEKDV